MRVVFKHSTLCQILLLPSSGGFKKMLKFFFNKTVLSKAAHRNRQMEARAACECATASARVAAEIWMHGVSARLSRSHFSRSRRLSGISCDKGIQGERGLLQKPSPLPLIICQPGLTGRGTPSHGADRRADVCNWIWPNGARAPDKREKAGVVLRCDS